MRSLIARAAVAITFGAALLAAEMPVASAAPLQADRLVAGRSTYSATFSPVQFRDGEPWRRGYHRGYDGDRFGGRGYGRHRGFGGGGVAAGVIGGLAAGAILGGAIAAQQAPGPGVMAEPAGNAEDYCAERFRSYDPSSGTYLGFDGQRHSCP